MILRQGFARALYADVNDADANDNYTNPASTNAVRRDAMIQMGSSRGSEPEASYFDVGRCFPRTSCLFNV